MRTSTFPVLLISAALAACGSGDAMAPTPAGKLLVSTVITDPAMATDSGQYLINIYQDNLGAAALAQAALRRATNERVRAFAQQAATNLDRLNTSITQIASTKNIPLAQGLTAAQQADVNRLDALVPDALNIVYLSLNKELLQADEAAAFLQASKGVDVDIRMLANTNLPRLQAQHAQVEEMENLLNPPVFLVTVHDANQAEIAMAQLALLKSTNDQVREFAQRMIDEHSQADAIVAALAGPKGIGLSTDLPLGMRAKLDNLSGFSGADFDKAYMDEQVVAHSMVGRMADSMANNSADPEIKALATQLAPAIHTHLTAAQQINAGLQPSYLYAAAQDANAQLRLAQLATEMGTNANMLAFDRQLVPATAGAMPSLLALAQQRNTSLPIATTPDEVSAFANLMQATGNDFDVQSIGALVTTLNRVLTRESSQSQDTSDMALSDLATANLPLAQQNANNAMQIQQQLGGPMPQ